MGRDDGLPGCRAGRPSGARRSFSYVTPELAVQAESFFSSLMKCRILEHMRGVCESVWCCGIGRW